MNRRGVKQRIKQNDSLKNQTILQYLLAVLLSAALIAGAGFLSYYVCNTRIWYGTEPLYPLLTWMKGRIFTVFFCMWLLSSVLLSYYYLAKIFRYLHAVVLASGRLAQKPDQPVELPPPMHNVEDELNLFREQALRNALLAKEAEQRKNDLIVYLAHDLKTPLTSVIGYLTLLEEEPQISEQMRAKYTGIALEKALRLEDLINEFFEITRFNLTALTLETEVLNISRMLEQIVSEFEPVLAEKELHWQTKIAPDVRVTCDVDKMQRVFDNLIRNAVNYSYSKTEIFLEMTVSQELVRICVKNHGRTIPPEKLSHIFEQFFRVDASRASATGGAGLGLAIAKEIVELHGGRILAESRDEIIVFTVELPANS